MSGASVPAAFGLGAIAGALGVIVYTDDDDLITPSVVRQLLLLAIVMTVAAVFLLRMSPAARFPY